MKIKQFIEASPVFTIMKSAQILGRTLNADLRGLGLNGFAAMILVSVFFEDQKTAAPRNLAKSFGTTKSNMSHILSSLEAKQLIRRKVEPRDRRLQLVQLTREGEKTCAQLIKYFDRKQAALEARLTEHRLLSANRVYDEIVSIYADVPG